MMRGGQEDGKRLPTARRGLCRFALDDARSAWDRIRTAAQAWLKPSATSATEDADFVRTKRLELLYRGFATGAASSLLVAFFMVASLWGRVASDMLLGWLAVFCALALLRILLVRRYNESELVPHRLGMWENRFTAGAAAAGTLWGLTPWLFIPQGDETAAMLVVFFLAGISSGSSAMHAPSRRTVVIFLFPALLPLAGWLFLSGGKAHLFMGAATLLHIAVLMMVSRIAQTMIWNAVSTGLENERLQGSIAAERRLAEEREKTVARLMELERENTLFRSMVERANDLVILVHDISDGARVVYANDAACRHFETDRATLLSWRPTDFDPHCDDALLASLIAGIRNGETFTFESEHRTATGTLIPVEVRLHPLEQQGKLLAVGYILDIRTRKAAEAQRLQLEAAMARREVEEHYRELVEAMPDFIVRLDTQARHVYVSPLALRGTGFDETVFLGKTVVDIRVTGTREGDVRLHEAAMRSIASGESNLYEAWWDLPNGRRCLEIRHIPEKDASGRVVSVLGIARDITERAKSEDVLQFVAQRGWAEDGEPFLTALARYLGRTLDVSYVIIDKLADDPGVAETVAIYASGDILPNMQYSLKGTPCENVMGGGMCSYSSGVRQLFPEDALLVEMSVESYIGLPLWDSAGKTLGLIAVMDGKPMPDDAAIAGLLKLVATRAAAELERERSEQALKAREREYRRLLDNTPDIIVRYDRECRRTYSNAAHARVVGRPTSLGKTPLEDWAMPTGPEAAAAYQGHLRQVLDSGEPGEWEMGWSDADGSPFCFLVRGVPEFDRDGKVSGVLIFAREISARKRLEIAIVAREQEFRALAENSPDFITRFDRSCRRTYINPSLGAILRKEDALGKSPTEYYPGVPQAEEYEALVRQVMESGEECSFLFNFPGKDGQEYCADMRIVPERDSTGMIVGVLGIGRDISDRLRLEEEMRHQASYDTLTGLPNRRLFGDRLREEIAKAERGGDNVALLFIDLDRFKEVNDTLGHEIGDQLLVEAANRIQRCVRESDTVARLGGDEFVAIFPGVADIFHLGRVAQSLVEAVAQPFNLGEHIAYVSASVGIAGYPLDANSADALISCADQAMYAAKAQGRNSFSFFTASMQAQAESRLHLANDLRGALAGRQLQVHYQPIVNIATGRVLKAEALLRWRHPALGMVPPDRFIPVAEDTGAIHELGDWVFREAAKTAGRWRELCGGACVQVSVNISPRQFVRDQMCASWIGHLAEMGLPGECMAIEITEGLLLGDQADIMGKLGRLREAGIRVALDDFGTGYSAMAYLKKFNIDYLKIDRSFVRDLATDDSDRAIAEAIVVMARKLGLKTIAEGVETAEQRDMLAAVGCEYVQGYLYARPMPEDEFLAYIANAGAGEAV